MAIDTRNCFWFGTEERMQFFATPLQGADSSPSAWGADGTLLNGGGWALNSWGSHKRYTYEWPASSSREVAQKMKSYRDGTYGRGLLYFLEPTIFTTNVLPAHWADPSMAIDNEAPSLVYGIEPSPVLTSGSDFNGLPVQSAYYNLDQPLTGFSPDLPDTVFIPIPEGHTLFLGAFYSVTGSAGVYALPVNQNGSVGTAVRLTELANDSTQIVNDPFSGIKGVRLLVRKETLDPSTITLTAMVGRLIETSKLPAPDSEGLYPGVNVFPSESLFPVAPSSDAKLKNFSRGPWIGGQGHSGCRFVGTPTYITNSPIEGGRIGFSATFAEVGSWSGG